MLRKNQLTVGVADFFGRYCWGGPEDDRWAGRPGFDLDPRDKPALLHNLQNQPVAPPPQLCLCELVFWQAQTSKIIE